MSEETNTDKLRQQMFAQMQDKQLFEQASGYAFEYADQVRERPVYPAESALAALGEFNGSLPENLGDPASVLEQLHRVGSPATVAQIGGRYFGMVNGGVVPVGLAARWLSDFWDQNTPLYVTSPVASTLETVTEGWLRELLGLPEQTVAGFVSGSSMAILCGLAAARFRLLQRQGWDINRQGLAGAPTLRIVAGRHAHGTVIKAVAMLGLGTDRIEWVDVDEQGLILANQVPPLDAQTLLILQAGNVNSGAFDDFQILCRRAREAGSWVHIDGAFGLWAAASESLKHLTAGIELADSFSVDGHKTLNTPYDNGLVLCTDAEALSGALQASGSYILYGEQRDGMLYTPEMSRRARVVELWATLAYLGREGVDQLVTGLHLRARQLAEEMGAAGFEIRNEVVFNQVLVGLADDSQIEPLLAAIQSSGECWAGAGRWQDRPVVRVSVCSWATTEADIERTVQAFVSASESLV
ncbi:pyridoxal phosphate-dependent decarboxylase family protein [Motiliproteus sp.]|uniref:pyridoxal phosphate-dependent decarboxylase family protein n=1 Tax=Motiliproteus sp. TaxID=1898955 RepID=UPI003BABDAAD